MQQKRLQAYASTGTKIDDDDGDDDVAAAEIVEHGSLGCQRSCKRSKDIRKSLLITSLFSLHWGDIDLVIIFFVSL